MKPLNYDQLEHLQTVEMLHHFNNPVQKYYWRRGTILAIGGVKLFCPSGDPNSTLLVCPHRMAELRPVSEADNFFATFAGIQHAQTVADLLALCEERNLEVNEIRRFAYVISDGETRIEVFLDLGIYERNNRGLRQFSSLPAIIQAAFPLP